MSESRTPRVCVVGAGRMGRALAARLAGEVTLVSRHAGVVRACGREVPVRDDPAAVTACDVVLLAVPAGQVAVALAWVAPHLDPEAMCVNLATELLTRDVPVPPGVRLVGCKIIGQSGQIADGVPAALVAEDADGAQRALLADVLAPVGTLVETEAQPDGLAARVNEAVARQIVAAQFDLQRALDALDVPAVVRTAALANLAPGIWRTLAAGTAGPYLRKIIQQFDALSRVVGGCA